MAVHLRSVTRHGTALAWTNGRSLTVDGGPGGDKLRVGFNADELLNLAVGASYLDALLSQAAELRVDVAHIQVDVAADAADEDQGLAVSITVEAGADEATVMDLIERADKRARACNRLRLGRAVRVSQAQVVSFP